MSRTVLVTGGGTGIGRAIAQRFAAGGDHVIVTGRRAEPLHHLAQSNANIQAHTCDHTDARQLEDLKAQLPHEVHVLVNNAGGNTDIGATAITSLADTARAWARNLDANLLSAVLTTQALDDRFTSAARVIHIGSIAADKGAGSYGAAKAAIGSWNTDLARQLGKRGITSNVVSPGYIADTEFFGDIMTSQRHQTLVSDTMVGRAGRPEDIAATVEFLASDAAGFLTAQVIDVNGGAYARR